MQGTYTIYATRPIPGAENGGRVELVEIGSDGSTTRSSMVLPIR